MVCLHCLNYTFQPPLDSFSIYTAFHFLNINETSLFLSLSLNHGLCLGCLTAPIAILPSLRQLKYLLQPSPWFSCTPTEKLSPVKHFVLPFWHSSPYIIVCLYLSHPCPLPPRLPSLFYWKHSNIQKELS